MAININMGTDKKLFAEGIYYGGEMCESSLTNHAVAVIGFNDTDINEDGYWLIKDSSLDIVGRSVRNEDHVISKVYWRDNFFSKKKGMCFCGGEGSECAATVFTKG